MLVSFPNMGNSWPAFKTLIECMDISVILPDPTNREAIKIGVKYSPEFVCFPFKATLGDFKNALDKGADTLIMAIDCGPCRFGFYASIQEILLKEMGYDNFRLIPLDQADLLTFNWVKMLRKIGPSDYISFTNKAIKAIQFFLKKAKLIEDIQTAEGIFRAYERTQGDTTRTINKLLKQLDETNTLQGLRDFRKVIKERFKQIDIDKSRNPLRVHLSGEIHISLEPYVNLDLRRKFGELGVITEQSLSLYDWIVHKIHLNYHRKWLEHLAKPWVPMDIGGECVWVLGEYIDAANRGVQGFVHSYPFTCMPEVTARTIITNALQKKYDLPVIYFSFDEQSGAEGFRTRLEAFVDLLNARRDAELKIKKNLDEKSEVLNHNGYVNNVYKEYIQLVQIK